MYKNAHIKLEKSIGLLFNVDLISEGVTLQGYALRICHRVSSYKSTLLSSFSKHFGAILSLHY